jgi:hypothetical protein
VKSAWFHLSPAVVLTAADGPPCCTRMCDAAEGMDARERPFARVTEIEACASPSSIVPAEAGIHLGREDHTRQLLNPMI